MSDAAPVPSATTYLRLGQALQTTGKQVRQSRNLASNRSQTQTAGRSRNQEQGMSNRVSAFVARNPPTVPRRETWSPERGGSILKTGGQRHGIGRSPTTLPQALRQKRSQRVEDTTPRRQAQPAAALAPSAARSEDQEQREGKAAIEAYSKVPYRERYQEMLKEQSMKSAGVDQ